MTRKVGNTYEAIEIPVKRLNACIRDVYISYSMKLPFETSNNIDILS